MVSTFYLVYVCLVQGAEQLAAWAVTRTSLASSMAALPMIPSVAYHTPLPAVTAAQPPIDVTPGLNKRHTSRTLTCSQMQFAYVYVTFHEGKMEC